MTDQRRFDRPAALLAALILKVNGAKGEISEMMREFMPFLEAEEPRDFTMEDFMRASGKKANGK